MRWFTSNLGVLHDTHTGASNKALLAEAKCEVHGAVRRSRFQKELPTLESSAPTLIYVLPTRRCSFVAERQQRSLAGEDTDLSTD